MNTRYLNSTRFISRAEDVIPLGSQTFSKSKAIYPVGEAPLFATKAKDCRIWDVDGNQYIDYVSNLASITLGYAHKGQSKAVKEQISHSVGMSLPSRLETIVAEKIVELVPSVEMVRFAKNGTDATSAAIRLSRAYTNRDHVAVCGYHGWQDWYIGTTNRSKGVPKAIQSLSHPFVYNDIESLRVLFEKYPNQIACVILEPMNREFPTNSFLESVIELCETNGSICIFDETITGFRFAKGGAQELFNVKPHLSTFGKGIANGYPLSVVCGRKEFMKEMENIFFSGTFGGELLSLSAANYVLDLHLIDKVCPNLAEKGEYLAQRITYLIENLNLANIIKFMGHPSWKFLDFADGHGHKATEIKAFLLQELLSEGILFIGTNNMSLAHNERRMNQTIDKYENALSSLAKVLENETLGISLRSPVMEPIIKLR
jgi:glutamate-1-semialdehyde 2,1-aminomutase